jgi:hypothetical protein
MLRPTYLLTCAMLLMFQPASPETVNVLYAESLVNLMGHRIAPRSTRPPAIRFRDLPPARMRW